MEIQFPTRRKQAGRWITASLNALPPAERVSGKGAEYADPSFLMDLLQENSKFHPNLMFERAPRISYAHEGQLPVAKKGTLPLPPLAELPQPDISLHEALFKRRSNWDFEGAMTFAELAALLQLSFGPAITYVHPETGATFSKRTYPSGGGLYPISAYFYAARVEGLAQGVYLYDSVENALHLIDDDPTLNERVMRLTNTTDPNRNPLYQAGDYSKVSCFFFFTADFTVLSDKYRLRSNRLAFLEAGHMAQNLLLTGAGLDMMGIPLGGYYDDRINAMLGLDGVDRTVLYMIPFGKGKAEGEF